MVDDPRKPASEAGDAQAETWLARDAPAPSRPRDSLPSERDTHLADLSAPGLASSQLASAQLGAAQTHQVAGAAHSLAREAVTVGRSQPPRPSSHDTRPSGAGESWEAAHLPPLPDHIGRFEIHGRLGAGGMGMVFEGRDAALDRRVAVKLLRLDDGGSHSDEASARLLREAQSLARLSHPNVIQVYEVGTWRGQVFVAMEFIDGQTFERWQADPELTWTEVLNAYLLAGRGLVAAHTAGIVHRDFKPSNVMRGHDGRVVVLDFGLARDSSKHPPGASQSGMQGRGPSFESRVTKPRPGHKRPAGRSTMNDAMGTPLTATGAVMGTPAYMAPEQHEGAHTDARTDQFAFCVSLYEALYGERPFEGGSLAMLASAVIEGRVRSVPEFARVPAWAREVLLRGLAVQPDARYSSMDALLDALDRVPSKRGRGLVAVGMAVAIAGVVAMVAYQRRGPSFDARAQSQRFRANLAAADLRGHELDADGHGTPASEHWDALVLAHARESMAQDPTEALASLQHLTPGDGHWIPAARILAAEARDQGVAWREHDFGPLDDLQITTLGDSVLALDALGRVHRWSLEDDQHASASLSTGPILSMALGGTGRVALLAGSDGHLWELELPELRATRTPLRTGCAQPKLRIDRDATRGLMLCEGRWRRLVRDGSGWADLEKVKAPGEILDAQLVDGGTLLLVREPGGPARTQVLRLDEDAGGHALGGEAEALAKVEGGLAFVSHPGSTRTAVYLRTRSGVLDLSSRKQRRRLAPDAAVARGAAGLVWTDGAELVVEHGLEGRRLRGHAEAPRHLVSAPAQARLVSVDARGRARAWRSRRGGGRLLRTGGGGIEALDLDARGRVLFTGSSDGRVQRRELSGSDRGAVELGKQRGSVRRLAASPDGRAVATVGESGGVHVWTEEELPAKVFANEQVPARVLQWSRASDRVAAGACSTGRGCAVHVFEPAHDREIQLSGPSAAIQRIAFSQDDLRVAAADADESGAHIWLGELDTFTNGDLDRAAGSFGRVEHMDYEDAQRLWVAWSELDAPETLRLWQIDADGRGVEISRLNGVEERFADGSWLAWRRAASVSLFDLRSGRVQQIFELDEALGGGMGGVRLRRGGTGVALLPAPDAPDGSALLVDFASHERRRVSFGDGPHAWGESIVDAPGPYLRSYDDDAPSEPEAFARWVRAESSAWVDPATMHRSAKLAPESTTSPADLADTARPKNTMNLTISRDWRGRALEQTHAQLELRRERNGDLSIEGWARRGQGSPLGQPPGRVDRLWEHEVLELFLLGEDGHYLELELGPGGHWLALELHGERSRVREDIDLAPHLSFEESPDPERWAFTLRLPARLLPPGFAKVNAHAIVGEGNERAYYSWRPADPATPEPDFHRLADFGEIALGLRADVDGSTSD